MKRVPNFKAAVNEKNENGTKTQYTTPTVKKSTPDLVDPRRKPAEIRIPNTEDEVDLLRYYVTTSSLDASCAADIIMLKIKDMINICITRDTGDTFKVEELAYVDKIAYDALNRLLLQAINCHTVFRAVKNKGITKPDFCSSLIFHSALNHVMSFLDYNKVDISEVHSFVDHIYEIFD